MGGCGRIASLSRVTLDAVVEYAWDGWVAGEAWTSSPPTNDVNEWRADLPARFEPYTLLQLRTREVAPRRFVQEATPRAGRTIPTGSERDFYWIWSHAIVPALELEPATNFQAYLSLSDLVGLQHGLRNRTAIDSSAIDLVPTVLNVATGVTVHHRAAEALYAAMRRRIRRDLFVTTIRIRPDGGAELGRPLFGDIQRRLA